MKFIRSAFIILTMAATAHAFQGDEMGRPDERRTGRPDERFAGGPPSDEKREEIRKKIDAVRIYRMTEELKLDENISVRFIPIVSSIDQARMALMRERMETIREMKFALDSKDPDEKRLKQLLEKIDKIQRDMNELMEKENRAIRENLSVEQQAKYHVFKEEFQREVREIINQARERSGPLPSRERDNFRERR